MFNYYKEFFSLKNKVELMISIWIVYIGILYKNESFDLQTLFFFTIFAICLLIPTGAVSSYIDIFLKTKKGISLEKLRISEGIESYIPFLLTFIPLIVSIIGGVLINGRINNYIYFTLILIFIIEVTFNLSFTDLKNNIIGTAIRLILNSLIISICFVDVISSNIVYIVDNILTLRLIPVITILIMMLPLVIFYLAISFLNISENFDSNLLSNNRGSIAFSLTIIAILSSTISVIYGNVGVLFLVLLLLLPIAANLYKKYNIEKYCYLILICYVALYSVLLVIPKYI